MKTYFIISVLIFGLAATNHGKPINDIYSIKEPTIEEEAYVDDIPFNTWDIASDIIHEGDEVKMEDEAYVDDIPFDTRAMACACLLRRMLNADGEANVNDIPFSTEEILCEYLAAKMREQYRNEANINDMPEELNQVIKTLQNGNRTSYTIIYPAHSVLPKSIRIETEADHKLMIIPNASL
jgi:hypothetical protein